MIITGIEQDGGFWENLTLVAVAKKEDIYSLFQAVTNIIEEPDKHLYRDWYPDWIFRNFNTPDWHICLRDDYMRCEQGSGCASVGLSSIPYAEIESIGCDLYIDGSKLVGIWITLKNGIQIRLL